MRTRTTRPVIAAVLAAGALTGALVATPAQATEYPSNLKIAGVQYDAPGRDNNSCTSGNTSAEFVTIKNFSRTARMNLKGYVVKDAVGNSHTFRLDHYLEPGDHVKLRGGRGTESDAGNVAYRNNCNFIWNNDRDTIRLIKPTGAAADTHAYTKTANDRDGNGFITFHA